MSALADFLLARLSEDEAGLPSLASELHHETWYTAAAYRADVEAKKRIVERCDLAGTRFAGFILRDLASVYADHEDYRPEWRPLVVLEPELDVEAIKARNAAMTANPARAWHEANGNV